MKTLVNTLIQYINNNSDMDSNSIQALLEAEIPEFPPLEQDWIALQLKPYEFENPRGNQVFELVMHHSAQYP